VTWAIVSPPSTSLEQSHKQKKINSPSKRFATCEKWKTCERFGSLGKKFETPILISSTDGSVPGRKLSTPCDLADSECKTECSTDGGT